MKNHSGTFLVQLFVRTIIRHAVAGVVSSGLEKYAPSTTKLHIHEATGMVVGYIVSDRLGKYTDKMVDDVVEKAKDKKTEKIEVSDTVE